MEEINVREFRMNLSAYLNKAREGDVIIKRGDKDRFILSVYTKSTGVGVSGSQGVDKEPGTRAYTPFYER